MTVVLQGTTKLSTSQGVREPPFDTCFSGASQGNSLRMMSSAPVLAGKRIENQARNIPSRHHTAWTGVLNTRNVEEIKGQRNLYFPPITHSNFCTDIQCVKRVMVVP